MLSALFLLSFPLSNSLLVNAAAPYCLPGQKCFPSAAVLSSFNNSISGRLHAPAPYASVCYNGTFNATACQILHDNQQIDEFRVDIANAFMFTNWEFDQNGNGCPAPPLTSPSPTSPLSGTCSLGALPKYEVFAESAADVSAAVKFAAKWNLRLRMKNTGHDYLGRSAATGSFTIWMHKMKSPSLSPAFKPQGCNVAPQPALVSGPALSNRDIYEFCDKNKVQLVGGFPSTVGASGGWLLGGGHGPFGRLYGMGVDNVLQYQVVTADGQIKIANECTNPDLFWALRGGGGTYGVVTQVVLKAHPPLKGLNIVSGTLTADSQETWVTLLRAYIGLYPTLDQAHFSGLSETGNRTIVMIKIQPFTDTIPAVSTNETLSHFSTLTSIPGVTNGLSVNHFDTWLQAYNAVVLPLSEGGAPVGVNLLLGDSIASKAIFNTPASREALVQFSANAATPIIHQFVAGGNVSTADDSKTSVNPAWRTALVHFNLPVFGPGAKATAEQHAGVVKITADADAALYPDGATPAGYYNEDYVEEPNRELRWWGSKYPRLLKLKKAFDPNGVFSCTACVGAEVFGS